MKEGRHRLKDVTNILQRPTKVDEVEKGYVVNETELLVLDDIIMDGSTDTILDDYQVDILDEGETSCAK